MMNEAQTAVYEARLSFDELPPRVLPGEVADVLAIASDIGQRFGSAQFSLIFAAAVQAYFFKRFGPDYPALVLPDNFS